MRRSDDPKAADRPNGEQERWALLQRLSDALDLPMALLALVWLGLLLAEPLGVAPAAWRDQLDRLDLIIWLAFLAQFLLELVIAPRKAAYVRRHWLTALSVVLPFFRVLRLVRALRALRSLSLLRIVLGANRATRAAGLFFGRHGFHYVFALVVIVTLAGAAGAYASERDAPGSELASFGAALWWASTMVTTINTGAEPVTFEGRVIGLLLRVVALSVFGYITGSVASYLVGQRQEARADVTDEDVRALRREVASLRRSIDELRRQLGGGIARER
jgi:voltage-gated potassium channel